MAQASFDAISATRRLQKTGFRAEQAEAVVQTVIQANSLTMQMVQDFADLKAHVTENMVTKAYLAETLGQYDLKNMVTKADIRDMATKSDLKDMVTRAHFDETVATLATKSDLKDMVTRARFDETVATLATKSDIRDMATKEHLRDQLDAAFAAMHADMHHALWIQGGVLGALILGLAGLILVQA